MNHLAVATAVLGQHHSFLKEECTLVITDYFVYNSNLKFQDRVVPKTLVMQLEDGQLIASASQIIIEGIEEIALMNEISKNHPCKIAFMKSPNDKGFLRWDKPKVLE